MKDYIVPAYLSTIFLFAILLSTLEINNRIRNHFKAQEELNAITPMWNYQLNIKNDSVMEVYDNGQLVGDYTITWKTSLDSIIMLDNPGIYILDNQ